MRHNRVLGGVESMALSPQTWCFLFADDATLIDRGNSNEWLRVEADPLLEQAEDWFATNCLKINEDKTQSLLSTLKCGEPVYWDSESIQG